MEGWMDVWLEGWMGVWLEGWMGVSLEGCMIRRVCGWKVGWVSG